MQSVPDRVAEESEFIGVCLFGKNGQSLQNTKVSWKHAWVRYADSKQQHAKYEFRIQVSALPLTENLKGNECPPRTACAKNSEGFRIFKSNCLRKCQNMAHSWNHRTGIRKTAARGAAVPHASSKLNFSPRALTAKATRTGERERPRFNAICFQLHRWSIRDCMMPPC